MKSVVKLSVVIPVYNSEQTLKKLVSLLFSVLEQYDLEVILVNDASKDKSEAICQEIASRRRHVKVISLRKNVGEHNAVVCGLNFCTGDYVAIIDDDLQNPPSEIIRLLDKAIEGKYDVVYSKYETKQHSLLRNFLSKVNNFFATYFINKPYDLYLSSFKIIKRDLIPDIIAYKGPFPYIDALILRITDNIGAETVIHESRKDGKSNYTFRKLFSLYLSMVINFSSKPLRLIAISGTFISIISFISFVIIFSEKYFLHTIISYLTLLIVLLFFAFGLAFMSIGLLGEYISKILMSINNTPQYTIKTKINILTEQETDIDTLIESYDRKAI